MHIEMAELRAAQDVVYRHFRATPQYTWPLLSEELGGEVVVKHENCTPTGAFKVRGGLVHIERLKRKHPDLAGVISATTGNHGQSLAYAGRAFGVPVAIVVPEGSSVEKSAAMRGFGAELIVHGQDFQAAREHSALLARERGYQLVPPYHPDLVLGVATYAHELFSAAGHLDAVLVPVGMGSGINAVIGVRDLMELDIAVIGVTAVGAPATARSFAARKVIATPSIDTFIDGVATREPDPAALDGIIRGASRIIEVTDDQAGAAMRLAFRCTHHLPCPAGALGLAALMGEGDRWQGKRVGVVFTSSNLDTTLASRVLAG